MDNITLALAKSYTDKKVSAGGGGTGEDGFSPIAKVTETETGATISITDKNGETSVEIKNGSKGDKGDKGEPGVSGVYVGSGEMPEGYNVQIDPDGESIDIITREEFSQLSETIADLPNNEILVGNIAEVVKTEVPLVKIAEQPTLVNSVDEMTDTSKAYVLISDGYFYMYMKAEANTNVLTTDDFVVTSVNTDGELIDGNDRIATKKLLKLSDTIKMSATLAKYEFFVYFYSGETIDTFVGKTSWSQCNTNPTISSNLLTTVATGLDLATAKNTAKYCRISLRDSMISGSSLSDKVDEFVSNITITQESAAGESWQNTKLAYNQPADYEDRIIALEKALEGIEYGTY